MFSREELEGLAEVCCRHDLLCVSDEVYEWLVYPGNEHIKIGTYIGTYSVCVIFTVVLLTPSLLPPSHPTRNVGKNYYYWQCWKNIPHHWMEGT